MSEPLPNLCWIDLETTGLDPESDVLLEIAMVVTDADLRILDEREAVFFHDISLTGMDPKVFQMHSKNDLFFDMLQRGTDVEGIEEMLVQVVTSTVAVPVGCSIKPPLCGSSVMFERLWLQKWMPDLYSKLHYRSIDVSTIKELMMRWDEENYVSSRDTSTHRAMDDIKASIAELAHYRGVLWGATSPVTV